MEGGNYVINCSPVLGFTTALGLSISVMVSGQAQRSFIYWKLCMPFYCFSFITFKCTVCLNISVLKLTDDL